MFKLRKSFFLALGLTAALAPLLATVFLVGGEQSYAEPIVGLITWHDFYKTGDYRFFLSLPVVFAGAFAAFLAFSPAAPPRPPKQPSAWLQFTAFAAGLTAGLAFVLMKAPFYLLPLFIGAAAVRPLSRFLVLVFSFFSAVGILCAAHVASAGAFAPGAPWPLVAAGTAAVLACASTYVFPKALEGAVAFSQAAIPLLLLRFGFAAHMRWLPGSTAVLWCVALGGCAWAVVRGLRGRKGGVSVLTVATVAAYLAWMPAPASFADLFDDLHGGELLLAWQQIVELKRAIFSEFVPTQGFLGLSYGFLNKVLTGGTAAAFPLAHGFLRSLAAAATAILAFSAVGPVAALALTPLFVIFSDRFFLTPVVALTLMNRRLGANPILWLSAYVVLSAIHYLWNVATGLALAAGFVPLALSQLARLRQSAQRREAATKPALAAAVGAGLFVVLVLPLAFSQLGFIRDNSAEYALSHGVAFWHQFISSLRKDPSLSRILINMRWETFRTFSIFPALFVLLYMVAADLVTRGWRLSERGCLAAAALIFSLFMFPYAFGRIDTMQLSRVGALSFLVLGIFLPLCAAWDGGFARLRPSALFFLGVAVAPPLAFNGNHVWTALPASAVQEAKPTADAVFADGAVLGLPGLGAGYFPKARLEKWQSFEAIARAHAGPGEGVFDLTNQQALYFYAKRLVPCPYASDLHAGNERIQSLMVSCLEANPPALAFIGPALRWGCGPASIRSYRIYRWFLDRGYVAAESQGWSYLLHPDKARDAAAPRALVNVFYQRDLQQLPLAWGRSMDALSGRFFEAKAALLPAAGEWKPPTPISGRENEFLFLRVEVTPSAPTLYSVLSSDGNHAEKIANAKDILARQQLPLAELAWAESGMPLSEERTFRFSVKSGGLLVPVSSDPRWLKARAIDRVRVRMLGGDYSLIVQEVRGQSLVR